MTKEFEINYYDSWSERVTSTEIIEAEDIVEARRVAREHAKKINKNEDRKGTGLFGSAIVVSSVKQR